MSDTFLRTLDEQVRPVHTAVLVVDMQNDFCAEGGYLHQARRGDTQTGIRVEDNERIAAHIDELATAARHAGAHVIWLRSVYDFKYLAEAHIVKRGGREGCCMEGSWGADFFRIRPAPGELVLDKHTFNGFQDTALDAELRARGVRTLVMAGVATNVCVDSTLRAGFFLGYHIVVPEDCVGSGNSVAHEGTLSTVRVNFGTVTDRRTLVSLFNSRGPQ